MARQSFFIGGKEFQATKIGAFQANGLVLKIQRIALPILGSMAGGKGFAEMDVKDLMHIISEKLDDKVMIDIVLPMLNSSFVACTSGEKPIKIDSEIAINQVFGDADGLADFYELVFEVLRFNFGSFFTKLMDRFGNKANGGQKAVA